MALRLVEQYPLGAAVEIYFEALDQWLVGVVVAHQPPAVWVQTSNGQQWFVTNGRRIRPRPLAS